ncbi:MAG: oligosaccharide flippase family protein, partial [Clostridia bacterium]|nr:oligosaccharide flippase family protein [Clostridia bacterium]
MKIDQKKSGIVLSYISQGILILSGVIYTPVMLRLLGQSEYGLYQLVFSTVSYMSLLSFGFSASYIRFYSRAKAKNDDNEISRINGMFLLIFVVLSIICCFCGAVMISNIRL